jgi:Ca2+-binding EF-hand superfamily protein
MGNELGNPTSKMGITALAITTPNIELKEFEKLLSLCRKLASEKQTDAFSKDELAGILKQVEKFAPPDTELFQQLFVLFDETGYEVVDYKNYLSGACVCLLSNNNAEKLKFAFSVYDTEEKGTLSRGDTKRCLLSVNGAAAYFGDPVLDPKEIDEFTLQLSKEIKSKAGSGVSIDESISYLLQHPTIIKFMKGEGHVKFGSPELKV